MFLKAVQLSPFKPLCLPQALAARWMLNRRRVPNTLCIGVDKAAEQPVQNLHAWLVVHGEVVLGGPVSNHVAVLRIGAEMTARKSAADPSMTGRAP